jgi:D-glycero-alpha-D-manno-heptose-7-phosphate kinase
VIITRTPFRISLFGGGTDYPGWFREHGGAVIATSIDKYCYLTVRHLPPFFEHRHRIVWSRVETPRDVDEIQHPAVRAILTEMNGHDETHGYEIHHDGDLPARSGLGSSSAFAVGLIHAMHALNGRMVSKEQLAREAIRIEQDVLHETVGCQDQVTTAHGGFNRIDFRRDGSIDINPVILPAERLQRLQSAMLLVFTGLSRYASEIAAKQIGNFKARANELTTMRGMVDEATQILCAADDPIAALGKLLDESWKLKRGLANGISTSRIDEIYDAALDAGALGGKLLGAGGGGFMMFMVPEHRKAAVGERLKDLVNVRFRFESGGSKVLYAERDGWDNGDA